MASLFARGAEFGIETGTYSINMEQVRERKRKMVAASVKYHVAKYKESGTNLILGEGQRGGQGPVSSHSKSIRHKVPDKED